MTYKNKYSVPSAKVPEPDDEPVTKSKIADDISTILRTPIVAGGNGDDNRDPRAQQSYGNDPVHEPRFDTSRRMEGPLSIATEKLEIDGEEYSLGFVRCRIGRDTDTANIAQAHKAGWQPCPLEKLPSYCRTYAYKSDLGDNLYIIGDLLLMMIPTRIKAELEARQQRNADFRMLRVEQNEEFLDGLPRDGAIQSRARPAVRETITGRHATAAVQDALDSAAKELHPAAQQHSIRGFRVRR